MSHEKLDVMKQHEGHHQELRELLGDAYNERKVDAIAGTLGFDTMLEEVRQIPTATNPEQRRRYINEWYKRHKETTDMFGSPGSSD